jgi:hypothetical protein
VELPGYLPKLLVVDLLDDADGLGDQVGYRAIDVSELADGLVEVVADHHEPVLHMAVKPLRHQTTEPLLGPGRCAAGTPSAAGWTS